MGLIVPGLATGLGGVAVLIFRRPSALTLDTLLGFTAGVMLAATAFSLLVPALDRGSLGEVLLGFALGSGFIAALDLLVPHAHTRFRERGRPAAEELAARDRATLLLSALTIHNLPEGLAVGVAFAAGGSDLGLPLAIAIGIQNVPEGFAAAAPLLPVGTSPRAAAGVAALTGVVEPPAALLAYATFERRERCSPERSPSRQGRCCMWSWTSSCQRATGTATSAPPRSRCSAVSR